ncbi:MAG: sulfite exporter TauE/SafE family protein [Clostridiales bacterium]|nr:sulfite exporter TauE/SafE family protein [Clostridiales bacterium]
MAIKQTVFTIGGMTCVNCENKIEQQLKQREGVKDATVSYNKGTAVITFDREEINEEQIIQVIEQLDYEVIRAKFQKRQKNEKEEFNKKNTWNQVIGVGILLLAISVLMKQLGLSRIFNAFPQVEENMGYGMLFLIGLVTSVHCIGMCGGIHLSQCLSYQKNSEEEKNGEKGKKKWSTVYPSFLYNLGRVVSYTIVGGVVGGFGSVISFSAKGKGAVQLIAGVFMVIMGINMLNIFPWLRKFNPRMPKVFARKINQGKQKNGAFLVGILNGLMPCGPLQAMQIYALSTGSPLKGAFSMFLFSMGTVPLMFGFGALSSFLSQKFTKQVMKFGAVLVVILGISMFQNGWSVSGFPVFSLSFSSGKERQEAKVQDGVQVVETTLSPYGYEPITVQEGIPVKWTIKAEQGSLTGCNRAILIPEYEIQKTLEIGENVIEFTPTKAGTYSYSCWMGMLRSSITVLKEGEEIPKDEANTNGEGKETENLWQQETVEEPAGYKIPVDKVAIATIDGDVQKVKITIGKNRFQPAIIVLQRGIETEWTIQIDKIKEGREQLLFPDYWSVIPLEKGENKLMLYPEADFDFSTENQKMFGYVKVVNDINKVNLKEIRKEVKEHTTYLWDYNLVGSME